MPRDGDLSSGSPAATRKPGKALQCLLKLAQMLPVGTLTVVQPDGREHQFKGRKPGPTATLHIHNERCIRWFFTRGILGFNEAYLEGDWSSPDIAGLFEYALRNEAALKDRFEGMSWYNLLVRLIHRLRPNTRKGAKRNISAHYDLGNAFYAEWLDPSMTYSSALFAEDGEGLPAAQNRKYENLAQQLRLKPGMHVLEIGCGWGGFAEYAARHHKVKVTAVTISQEQFDYATRRIREAGLDDLVEIRFQDYRDITETFDAIASIEMFEAVGEAYWPTYFRQVHDRLKPGARAALQIITISNDRFEHYRRSPDYIQRYIFPGGMLPSPAALAKEIDRAGLQEVERLEFGQSYARTLELWNLRFQARWPQIMGMGFDDRFKRMWEQYLAYCQAGFATGAIDVVQVAMTRRDDEAQAA